MNRTKPSVVLAFLLAAFALTTNAADSWLADRAHYQRPNEPRGQTAFVHLPPGVVQPERRRVLHYLGEPAAVAEVPWSGFFCPLCGANRLDCFARGTVHCCQARRVNVLSR